MPIAWHAAPQQKGDSLRVETPSSDFYSRAFVPLPIAAQDFVTGFRPAVEDWDTTGTAVQLVAHNLLTGASHDFTFLFDPSTSLEGRIDDA